MEQIEGTLSVTTGKKGKIFKAKFVGKKGPAEQSIFPQVMFCNLDEAKDGDPIIIERDGGQIKKVTIKGKAECAPTPAKASPTPQQSAPGSFGKGPSGGQRFEARSGGYQGGQRFIGSSQGSQQRSFSSSAKPNIPPATAPYNFIEQTCILEAPKLPSDEERYSGTLVCDLTALTPVMVGAEQNRVRDPNAIVKRTFMTVDGNYVIPGSAFKGLLRSTVELLTCSAMHVMNNRRFFTRNFNESKYRALFKIGQETPQKAGYLVRRGADFAIIPVRYTSVRMGAAPTPGKLRVCTGPIPRKNHDYDFEPFQAHEKDPGLPIPDELIDDFILQITPAQEQTLRRYDINGADGIRRMVTPLPVFFLEHAGQIDAFGLARYFRYPSRYSTFDLRDNTMQPLPEGALDFAMQLFGYARAQGSMSGRIGVSAAFFAEKTQTKVLPPVILGKPHPSCFAHYLAQDVNKMSTMPRNPSLWDVNSMRTFNDLTSIRGRKFYWHRDVEIPPVNQNNIKNQCILEPVVSNAKAEFTVYVERLSLIELGALVEALLLPEGHAHKIGLGKSLGLGSVRFDLKTSTLQLDRERYSNLEARCQSFFDKKTPAPASDTQEQLLEKARAAFRAWLLDALSAKGKKYAEYSAIPHIQSFLHMTDFAHKPDNRKTCPMELKEFRALRVLPHPDEIV